MSKTAHRPSFPIRRSGHCHDLSVRFAAAAWLERRVDGEQLRNDALQGVRLLRIPATFDAAGAANVRMYGPRLRASCREYWSALMIGSSGGNFGCWSGRMKATTSLPNAIASTLKAPYLMSICYAANRVREARRESTWTGCSCTQRMAVRTLRRQLRGGHRLLGDSAVRPLGRHIAGSPRKRRRHGRRPKVGSGRGTGRVLRQEAGRAPARALPASSICVALRHVAGRGTWGWIAVGRGDRRHPAALSNCGWRAACDPGVRTR